jgi:hypothetical protein
MSSSKQSSFDYGKYKDFTVEELEKAFSVRDLAKLALSYIQRKAKEGRKNDEKPKTTEKHKATEKPKASTTADASDDDDVVINREEIRRLREKKEEEARLKKEREAEEMQAATLAKRRQELEEAAAQRIRELEKRAADAVAQQTEQKLREMMDLGQGGRAVQMADESLAYESSVAPDHRILDRVFKYEEVRDDNESLIRLKGDDFRKKPEQVERYTTQFWRPYAKAYIYINMHLVPRFYDYWKNDMKAGQGSLSSRMAKMFNEKRMGGRGDMEAINASFAYFEAYSGLLYNQWVLNRETTETNARIESMKNMLDLSLQIMAMRMRRPNLQVVFYPGLYPIQTVVDTVVFEKIFPRLKEKGQSILQELNGKTDIDTQKMLAQIRFLIRIAEVSQRTYVSTRDIMTDDFKGKILEKLQRIVSTVREVQEATIETRIAELKGSSKFSLKEWTDWISKGEAKPASKKRPADELPESQKRPAASQKPPADSPPESPKRPADSQSASPKRPAESLLDPAMA